MVQQPGMRQLAFLTGVAATLMVPGLLIGPSLDASVFLVVGESLLRGDLLYVDVWDHKPPLAYVPFSIAAGLGSFELSWLAIWGVTVVSTAAAGYLVARTLVRTGVPSVPSVVASALTVAAAGHYFLALGGGMTESLAILPSAGAMTLVLRPTVSRQQVLAAGALAGVSMLISPQALPVAPAALIAIWLRDEARARRLAVFGIGAAVVLLLVAGGLAASGSLFAALDALVGYSAAYRSSLAADFSAYGPVPWAVLSLLFMLVPGILGLRRVWARPLPARAAVVASVVWLLVGGAGIVLQGRFYAHYAIPLAVPLGILAGVGIEDVRRVMEMRAARPAALVVGATTVALSLAVGFLGATMEARLISYQNSQAVAVAARLGQFDTTASPIFVWGNQPNVYLRSGRQPASRFVYFYPLTTPGYSSAEHVRIATDDLGRKRPEFIIDAGSVGIGHPGAPSLLVDRGTAGDGRDLDLLDPLRDFVRQHYEFVDVVAGWQIYRLVD